jgi:hypothetical protein
VTDGQSVSKSWCQAPSVSHDQIFITIWQLRSCFRGAPSLTRGWVFLLYMLLVIASAIFLGSESLGTRDHILLSQIWDCSFRRLLQLTWSRWRYSYMIRFCQFYLYSLRMDHIESTASSGSSVACLFTPSNGALVLWHGSVFTVPLPSNGSRTFAKGTWLLVVT